MPVFGKYRVPPHPTWGLHYSDVYSGRTRILACYCGDWSSNHVWWEYFVRIPGRLQMPDVSMVRSVGRMRVERNGATPLKAVLGRDFADPSRRGDTLGICSGVRVDVWVQSSRSVF